MRETSLHNKNLAPVNISAHNERRSLASYKQSPYSRADRITYLSCSAGNKIQIVRQ